MPKKKKINKAEVFNKKELKNQIVALFNAALSRNYNYKQIAKQLHITDISTKQLILIVLQELKESEILEEIQPGKYKFRSSAGHITGVVDITNWGAAYIVTDEIKEDIYVSESHLNHALHGDTVKVFIYGQRRRGRAEGEVVEILKRAKTTFVGTIESSRHYAFLHTDDRYMPHDIFIPAQHLNHAEGGQKAIVEIIEWPAKSKNPIGRVIEVLGEPGDNDVEMHAILAEFDLPNKFTEKVEKEAEKIPYKIPESEIAARRDFRNTLTLTIDPADAKDFDDALSLSRLKNGHWEVGVHIADVSYYLLPDSILDREAVKRPTSVYLVDRVVPMLPEKLSNYVCSLRPGEEKLCYSAVFEMNDKAEVLGEWFGRTIIRSDRRYNYDEAQTILEKGKGDNAKELLTLNVLAKKLREERFKKGAIGFDREEIKFHLDEKGVPTGVYTKENKDSNKLIEEFMLLANRKVAEKIGKPKDRGLAKTFVYRIHDKPDMEKLQNFSDFVKNFGYKVSFGNQKTIPQEINRLLVEMEGNTGKDVIATLAIRAMAKAEYSTKNIGHYGLGFRYYTHFTSPIRRYPDVMVHRLLDQYLKNGKSADQDTFEQLCKHSSEMERKAADAERASTKYKQAEFLSTQLGKIFTGIISGVTEWGLYVEMAENKCEGMIPLREMKDDYYIFDDSNHCITGKYSKRRFRLGDQVMVSITRVNMVKKQVDLSLAESDEEKPKNIRRQKRR